VPVEDARVYRGFSPVVRATAADGEDVRTLVSMVSLTGVATPELQAFAEHSRPSPSSMTYSYSEWQRGPFARFDAVDPVSTRSPTPFRRAART
jgi:hypothetical protein